MTILLLTNKWDVSIDYVVDILHKRNISFLRINTEDIMYNNSTITAPDFSFVLNRFGINHDLFNDVTSILHRRTGTPFEFIAENKKPTKNIINYIADQWRIFISSLQYNPNILWVNNPIRNNIAENKIIQLFHAKKIGLHIPNTCITNSKKSFEKFWFEHDGKVIAKSLYAPLIHDDSKDLFIFSNSVSINDVHENELSLAPTIFQEEITNKSDYRITIIGNEYYCAKIVYTGNNKNIDWRIEKNNIIIKQSQIPSNIAEKCIKLVKELGLVFGAIDLIEQNGMFYFLEINPSGEWGWLQNSMKFPIAETLVNYLNGEKHFE